MFVCAYVCLCMCDDVFVCLSMYVWVGGCDCLCNECACVQKEMSVYACGCMCTHVDYVDVCGCIWMYVCVDRLLT